MATDLKSRPERPSRKTAARPRWSHRIAGLLPGVVLLLVFGFWIIDKSSEALTAIKSVRAVVVVAAIIGGWIGLSWVLRRFVHWVWVRSATLSAIALVLAFLLVRPYYVDTADNTKLVKGTVLDASRAAPLPPAQSSAPGTTVAPAGPVRLSAGPLHGIGHSARGEAAIIRRPDGSFVVRFSNFDIQSVPDPIVYVVRGESREGTGGGIQLGGLRGNVGNTSDYAVPAGTEVGPGWTVLVWCRSFGTPVANATQAPV